MISYWEKQSFERYDCLVIGGGLIGLSTAISLKEKDRTLDVAVIERGILPSGASTKNAGFACFGSPTELRADMLNVGKESAMRVLQKRWRGLTLLRERLGDSHLGFQNKGGYELVSENESYILDELDELNKWLYDLFGSMVFIEKKDQVKKFGFDESHFKTAIFNPFEGQLDTGLMMKSCIKYAQLLGISIYTGTELVEWEESDKGVTLWCQSRHQQVKFTGTKVAFCTNAFTRKLVPTVNLNPGRGQVLITAPIPDLAFEGTFHFNEGFYYFRDIKGRVLLGGGRNTALKEEETEAFGLNENIQNHLINILESQILKRRVKIEMQWSGIMAFGDNKNPIVDKVSSHIYLGVRLGGMGVAVGSMVGEQLSDLILSEH